MLKFHSLKFSLGFLKIMIAKVFFLLKDESFSDIYYASLDGGWMLREDST